MAAAAGGATQHPRGVNENKVNAFSPYYLTLEEKEAGGGQRGRKSKQRATRRKSAGLARHRPLTQQLCLRAGEGRRADTL